MSAYWIAHVTVKDAEQYKNYMTLAPLAFKKFNARFLARGEKAVSLEGDAYIKHVVIEFSDYATAVNCYHSAEYQTAKKQREHVADAMITIVDGVTT